MSLQLQLALEGNLQKYLNAQDQGMRTAATATIKYTADQITFDMRNQVRQAGMGIRFSNTWQDKVYPKDTPAINPAGYVYSKASYMRGFNDGVVIRSKDGFFLAIPTPEAGKGLGGKRLTPGEWEKMHGERLRYIYRAGGASLLVADDQRARTGKRGGFSRASDSAISTGRGLTSVIIFFLVPQVTITKRLNFQAAYELRISQLPAEFAKRAVNEFNKRMGS